MKKYYQPTICQSVLLPLAAALQAASPADPETPEHTIPTVPGYSGNQL